MLRGTNSGSYMHARVNTEKSGRIRARKQARMDARCKRLSGAVKVRKLTPEELEKLERGERLDW